jgi:hypothetical protein
LSGLQPLDFRPMRKNSLGGFAAVRYGNLVIDDVVIGGRAARHGRSCRQSR